MNNSQKVKPKIGRDYKFWHDWSDEDFQQWAKLISLISSRYRILQMLAGLLLLTIGILEITDESILNGIAFTGFGVLILFFLVLSDKEKR